MTWNLAYDHFTQWIINNHLVAFNAAAAAKYRNKAIQPIKSKEEFADYFRESEVIEISKAAGFLQGNVKKILLEKLGKRNMAAHPSLVEITQIQAEDVISDLVNNVILKCS
jgi:hypothetical protein